MSGLRAFALACALVLAGAGTALAQSPPSADVQRLSEVLAAVDSDPALAGKAALERYQAQQAIAALRGARSRDREHALWLAEAYVAAARDAAQAEALAEQSRQLDRERDQLLLEASRQQADAAWREADRLRQAALAREEEAARLAVMQEQERLANEQLAAEVGGKRIRIEAHTDSQGGDAANLALSQQRAAAVRKVLSSAGVPAARITAVGKGETDPLTDNGTAEGRARNRRVEISLE